MSKVEEMILSLPRDIFCITGSYAIGKQTDFREWSDLDVFIEGNKQDIIKKFLDLSEEDISYLGGDEYNGPEVFETKEIDGKKIQFILKEKKEREKDCIEIDGVLYRSVEGIIKSKIEILKTEKREDKRNKHLGDITFFLKEGIIEIKDFDYTQKLLK